MLVTASGSIISDSKASTAGDTRPWTLGYYLNKRHISPEKIQLGIARTYTSGEKQVTYYKGDKSL